MFHYYFENGKDILTIIAEMYEQYGYFNDDLLNYEFIGIKGQTLIKNIMQDIRANTNKLWAGIDVLSTEDYLSGVKTNKGKENTKLTLPVSDVYRVLFESGAVAFRPSGTEPKMKIYISIFAPSKRC